jgi:hypothetical protein
MADDLAHRPARSAERGAERVAEPAIAIATISAIAAAPLPAVKAAPWRHPRSAHVTLPPMGYHGSPRGGEHKV